MNPPRQQRPAAATLGTVSHLQAAERGGSGRQGAGGKDRGRRRTDGVVGGSEPASALHNTSPLAFLVTNADLMHSAVAVDLSEPCGILLKMRVVHRGDRSRSGQFCDSVSRWTRMMGVVRGDVGGIGEVSVAPASFVRERGECRAVQGMW